MIPILGAALVAVVVALYLEQCRQRSTTRQRFAVQDAKIGELLDELVSLRSTMVATGAAERGAQHPPAPLNAEAQRAAIPAAPVRTLPWVARRAVDVTRGNEPLYTRKTVAEDAGAANDQEEHPPSTKPSSTRRRRVDAEAKQQAPAAPASETSAQMRARLDADEDARDQARKRGEIGDVPTLGPDRPSEAETQVFSAAEAAARLRVAHAVAAPRVPRAAADPADSRDDPEEMTKVRPIPATDAPIPRIVCKPAALTTGRPPPHSPPRPAAPVGIPIAVCGEGPGRARRRVRRRRSLAAGLVLTLAAVVAPEARAQTTTFAVDRLTMAGAPDDGIGVWRSDMADTTRFFGQLGLGFALNPLRVASTIDNLDNVGKVTGNPLTRQVITYFGAGVEILGRVSLQVAFTVIVNQAGNATLPSPEQAAVTPASAATGDLRVEARVVLACSASRAFSLALNVAVYAPTGNRLSYGGDNGPGAAFGFAGEYDVSARGDRDPR